VRLKQRRSDSADAGFAGVGRNGPNRNQTPEDHHGREAAGSSGGVEAAGIEPAFSGLGGRLSGETGFR
jgi:hypothetical protein